LNEQKRNINETVWMEMKMPGNMNYRAFCLIQFSTAINGNV